MTAIFEAETSKRICRSWRAWSPPWWKQARRCHCRSDLTELKLAKLPTPACFQANPASCERLIRNVNADCVRNLFGKHTPDACPRRRAAAAKVNGRKVVLVACSSRRACQLLAIVHDTKRIHFEGISNQKPGSKVMSLLCSVPWIQLSVTKDRSVSFL